MSNVKVFSTQMGEKQVDANVSTWGELKDVLSNNGISYSGMKAVIGETKVTLESSSAQLPEGDFTLFLMPKKTKSGVDHSGLGYREIRARIKDILEENPDAKDHFNQGRNYTTKSTSDLRSLLEEYDEQQETSTETAQETPAATPTESTDDQSSNSDLKKFRQALDIIDQLDFSEVDEELHEEIHDTKTNLEEYYRGLKDQLEVKENPLANEYKNLASEFDDVSSY